MHRKLHIATAIILLISVSAACSFLHRSQPFTWHVLLEIDGTASDRAAKVNQIATIIERRLDGFGVSNAAVLIEGNPENGRIRVNLPDVPDRERVKNLIAAEGELKFAAVVSPSSPAPVQTYATEQEAVASLGEKLPANRRVLPYRERDEIAAGEKSFEQATWVVVEVPAIFDGSELRDAKAVPSPGVAGNYEINFSLKPEGAMKFASWTSTHINNYIGVVLNREVKSIAYIRSQISDQGQISGSFTKQSAEDLALVLRSGALPAPVKIVEEGDNK